MWYRSTPTMLHQTAPVEKRSLEPGHTVQYPVYLRYRVLGELYPRGRRVIVDLLGPGGADDGAANVLLAQHPGEGELRHAQARLGGDGAQPVHGRKHFLVHELLHEHVRLRVGGAGALLGGVAGTVLAGEDALGERREDDLAYAFALAQGYHFGFDAALDHVVLRLVGDDPVQVHLFGYPQRVGDLIRRPLGDADVEHLPLPNKVVERPGGLFERRVLVVAVALVEVDVVDAKPLQRGVTLLCYVLAREPAVVRALAHPQVHLRRQKVRVALEVLQRPAHYLLRGPAHVHVGRVEEVDADLVRPVDAGRRLLRIDAPAVGQPAPERDLTDLHPATTQPPVLHRDLPRVTDER